VTSENNRARAEEFYFTALDLFAEGKADEAVVAFLQSNTADATYTDALHGLTRVYMDMGKLDDAIATAQKISAADPDDVLAHTSLSMAYQRKGMVPEAEAESNKARILGWKHQLREQKEAAK